MTEIQQNRWDQLVRRVSNIVGGGSQVNDTLNELFPTLDVESQVAELMFLAGTRRGIATVQINATAAVLNHHQLFNPVGSGLLVTLTRVDIRDSAGQLVEFDTAVAPLTNLTSNPRLRDSRGPLTALPVAQPRNVQQAGGLPAVGSIIVQANVSLRIDDPQGLFVMAPGTGVTFATTVVNTSSQVMFWWRERLAEPAELNFP